MPKMNKISYWCLLLFWTLLVQTQKEVCVILFENHANLLQVSYQNLVKSTCAHSCTRVKNAPYLVMHLSKNALHPIYFTDLYALLHVLTEGKNVYWNQPMLSFLAHPKLAFFTSSETPVIQCKQSKTAFLAGTCLFCRCLLCKLKH